MVADDTIQGVLLTFLRGQSCLLLFIKSVFVLFVDALCIPFRGRVEVCSASNPIHVHGIFNSVLHDDNDFGSDTYNPIWSQPMGVEF